MQDDLASQARLEETTQIKALWKEEDQKTTSRMAESTTSKTTNSSPEQASDQPMSYHTYLKVKQP